MENQNENFKKIIIIIILIVSISFFVYFKFQNNEEEFYYNEVLIEEISTVLRENIQKEKIKVYITGEINLPGVKELELGARLEDLINLAGGLTEEADIKDLLKLPGLGESLAQRIINYREGNGKFKNIEALKTVSGIGEKKFESLKEYIVVK